jgi:hypothetical protein
MEPFLLLDVGTVMFFLLMAALGSHFVSSDAALKLCCPVLARKAGGEIDTITVGSSRTSGKDRMISGSLTAFLGMAPPAPGSASAHHLIRAEFSYRCTVRRRAVRSASVRSTQ